MGSVSVNNPVSPTVSGTSSTTSEEVKSKGTRDSIESTGVLNSFSALEATNKINKNNVISLDSPISVADYTLTVGTALNENKAQQGLDQLINSDLFARLAKGLVSQSQAVSAVAQAVTNLGTQIENLENTENSQIQTLQTAISQATAAMNNNGTQSALDNYTSYVQNTYDPAIAAAMSISDPAQRNAAIAAAQAGLNSAIGTYNSSAQSINSANSGVFNTLNADINTFNQQQTANNATITALNAKLQDLVPTPSEYPLPAENFTENNFSFNLQTDLPTLTNTNQTTAPSPNPGSVSYPQNNLSTVPVETAATFVENNLTNELNSLNLNTNTYGFNDAYNAAVALNDSRSSKTAGSADYLPNAYISVHAHVTGFSLIDAGGGAALTGIGSAPAGDQEKAISKAILSAFTQLQGVQVPLESINQLANFATQLNKNGGLIASLPGLATLGAAALASADTNTAFSVAFGISTGQSVASIIKSGVVEDGVQQILQQSVTGADPSALGKAVAVGTAVVNQSLASIALGQASNDLGTPGLFGQVLGNTNTETAAALAQAIAAPPTLHQTLNDLSNQTFLANSLTNTLTQNSNSTAAQASTVVNQAINTLLTQQINTSQDLNEALVKAFNKTQLDTQTQTALTNQASKIIQAQQNAQQTLSINLLNQNTSEELLKNQLLNAGIENSDEIASRAISDVINNISITNNEQYRLDLQASLQQENINEDVATQVATKTVQQASSGDIPALFNPIFVAPAPLETISQQLYHHVVNSISSVSNNSVAAADIANTAVATFVGTGGDTPSLLEIYRNSAETLNNNGVKVSISDLDRDIAKKTDDSLNSLNMIHEPGKLLLHSSWTSIFSAGVAGDTSVGLPVPGRGIRNPIIAG